VHHTFASAGTYTVRATAVNEDGTFSANTLTVKVTDPAPADPGTTLDTAIDLGELKPRFKKLIRETLAGTRRALYYKLTVAQPTKLDTTMSSLKGNADLALLDSAGNAIVNSAKPSRKSERVLRVLTPGTYYLRVTLAADATTTPLKLLIGGKAPSKKELKLLA